MRKFYTLFLLVLLGNYIQGQTCPTSTNRQCTGGTIIQWSATSAMCNARPSTITYKELAAPMLTFSLNKKIPCSAGIIKYRPLPQQGCTSGVDYSLDFGGGLICTYDGLTGLPVSLSSFNSKTNQNTISLNWRTEAEFENAGFEIQRSNNNRDWNTIAFIEGQGSTIEATDYTYTDTKPLKGMQYYRLNQVDYDGKSTFSKVISVKFQTIANVSIYPNPAKDRVFIDITATGINTAIVFDNIGRKVVETTLNENGIDISSLDAGIYFVQITNGNLVEKIRFIKE